MWPRGLFIDLVWKHLLVCAKHLGQFVCHSIVLFVCDVGAAMPAAIDSLVHSSSKSTLQKQQINICSVDSPSDKCACSYLCNHHLSRKSKSLGQMSLYLQGCQTAVRPHIAYTCRLHAEWIRYNPALVSNSG